MGLRSLQRHLRPRGISGAPCSRPRARRARLLPIRISPSYLEQMMPLLLRHHQLVAVRHHGVHVHQPIPELLVLRLKLLQAGEERRPSSVTARTEGLLVLPARSPVASREVSLCRLCRLHIWRRASGFGRLVTLATLLQLLGNSDWFLHGSISNVWLL